MPNESEDILNKLAPSIVEIIHDDNNKGDFITRGTGFIVSDDGLIVTCRHVITDSEDNLVNSVVVRFNLDVNATIRFTASLFKGQEDCKYDPSKDIAFLRPDSLPERGVTPVELDDKVVSLNDFVSIGFRKASKITRLSAQGNIGILTHMRIREGILSPQVIQLYHEGQIEPGMSGAPVLDKNRNRVVGIITHRYKSADYIDQNLAFALPVKSMLDIYPILRTKNPGLTLLSKFLYATDEKVESSIHKWIDEVYVPPIEYEVQQ